MMTPQEVANCTFAKSMVGGYNMASVDDFLDKLTEDYAALYKENAALKAKLKMTVDKMSCFPIICACSSTSGPGIIHIHSV